MPISTESSGLVFTGCEISAGASASAGGGSASAHAHASSHAHAKRWEVVIAGKRIKTVDVHAHCIVPDAAKIINHPLEAPALLWSDVGTRLAHMDKSGVDVEALSINPFWYRARNATRRNTADKDPERDPGRVLRWQQGSLCRLRDRRAANSPTSPRSELSMR